ncbi:MAG: HPr family phosphocarrier protein [Maledivibacter sp.]|jgi:phosphocarrier protein|nr:HPr family phosphocarrier protein [Maledivibacter sp.]
MEKTVKILNESGLHARPAAVFVKTASKFKSEITIESKGVELNAKSIMNILSMGAKQGDTIRIITDGPDEKEALEELVGLIESKFDEK